MSELDR